MYLRRTIYRGKDLGLAVAFENQFFINLKMIEFIKFIFVAM
jgi:hypothetical protein